jgi:hypothetical protein
MRCMLKYNEKEDCFEGDDDVDELIDVESDDDDEPGLKVSDIWDDIKEEDDDAG